MSRGSGGHPDSPHKARAPERLWKVRGRGHPLGFRVGKRGPREAETHLPVPRSQESGAPCSGASHACEGAAWRVGQREDLGVHRPAAPGRRKQAGCLWPGPGSPTRDFLFLPGRCSCHSATSTLTRHGRGHGTQTQRLPEWEPGHLGEAAGRRRGGEVSSGEGLVLGWGGWGRDGRCGGWTYIWG